jgi:hypothetical protein
MRAVIRHVSYSPSASNFILEMGAVVLSELTGFRVLCVKSHWLAGYGCAVLRN